MLTIYKFLANIILITHFLFGVFVLFGWLFPEIKEVYLLALVLWLFSWVFLHHCPLTKLELYLRKKYDNTINTNAEIIQYYINKIFKKDIPTKTIFKVGLIIFILLTILSMIY